MTELERDVIERFYFHGESVLEVSIMTGRRFHRIRSAHDRAMRKLRRQLAGFVREEFGLNVSVESDCPVCNSMYRKQIERLMQQRHPTASLQPLLDRIATEFDLPLKTSTVLIRHEKYH